MTPLNDAIALETRRQFFRKTGGISLGAAALASIDQQQAMAGTTALASGGLGSLPHFAPKAKRVIYLFMSGGPAQQDLFDYKPKMKDWFNKDLPESVRQGQRLTTMTSKHFQARQRI